ncbi:MAG: acyl-CoA dehydratase activase-related protein, partial [Coriobacteriales bacterium]
FIDMMAGLMGVRSDQMQRLALGATTIYPIASRCAVFAKSDVRPLLNAGAKKEDIAASVLEAVCTQAVAGLSAGRPLDGTVALLGGPFHYIPALRDAFCRVTGIDDAHAIVPDNAHLFVAYGAAISPEHSEPHLLSEFEAAFDEVDFSDEEGIERLPALFASEQEYEDFKRRHATCKVPRTSEESNQGKNYFIGIDAGSTTMKVALIDETGALVAYEYDWNHGDVTKILPKMLKSLYRNIDRRFGASHVLRRSCIIGYGEQYCKAAFGVDTGEVETVAHLRAATEIDPDVDFLLDIGGQDIKCFYVKDGQIEDVVLNEACSSGCGSLFDSIARSMRYRKDAFAAEAVKAKSPVNLGTRCATFMDSRVKHAQKDGVTAGDIAAGICYATARNALYKVVREPDFSKVGPHVVVQGGAFANDGLLRAFELECGVEVKRPDLSQIMGAWGAALLARDEWLDYKKRDPECADRVVSSLLAPDELDALKIVRRAKRCDICGNNCKLMVTCFKDGGASGTQRIFVTGNRCEKGARAFGDERAKKTPPPNMIEVKNSLIKACDTAPQPQEGPAVGIPRVLALYESYPFWRCFFNELGCRVVSTGDSSVELYRDGMGSIPSEGACYPSKLVYGHYLKAVEQGADLLFAPTMTRQFSREGLLGIKLPGTYRECPLVQYLPEMLEANLPCDVLEKAPLLTADLGGATVLDEAEDALVSMCVEAGIASDAAEVVSALAAAQDAYRTFFSKLERANEKLLERVDAGELRGALVMEHAYHADPGIGHGIADTLGELGYAVFEQVDYDFSHWDEVLSSCPVNEGRSWTANRDLFYRIEASAAHPNLELIIPRSFGCGVDALAADAVHERLRSQGRVFAELKIDQIVDMAAVRIRLRSLAYAQRQRRGDDASAYFDEESWTYLDDAAYGDVRESRREEAQRLAREKSAKAQRDERRAREIEEIRKRYESAAPSSEDADVTGSISSTLPRPSGPHAKAIGLMRDLGFLLVSDGATERSHRSRAFMEGIIFMRGSEVFDFTSWDEVDAYLKEHHGKDEEESSKANVTQNQWGASVEVMQTFSFGATPPAPPSAPPGAASKAEV